MVIFGMSHSAESHFSTRVVRVLSTAILLISLFLYTTVPTSFTKAAGSTVSITGEPYIISTYIIKDGSTFKMWYTHLQTSLSLTSLATGVGSLFTQAIINDISANNLNLLLNDLATLNVDDLFSMLNSLSTFVGYATSSDGITWSVVNHTVLAGTGGGAWNSVGLPCVIKDGSTYKMWYTGTKLSLSKSTLQGILTGFGGSASERKAAIINLLANTTTAIYYATSNDGITWIPNSSAVLTSSSGLWDSTASPSVIKDGTTYRMWYTRGLTSLTGSDLDTILADPSHFGIDNLMQELLSKTGTAIGYATSPDGTTWTVVNAAVIAGSGSVWDSAATPSVLKTGSGYEMWFSRVQTDLTSSGIHTLLQDLRDLAPTFGSLMTTLKSGNYDKFLTDLTNLVESDMTAFKADVAHTNSVITYATSTDGIAWGAQNPLFSVGSALWNSVGAPCVILDNGVHKMWYMKGMAQLSAQNIVDYLQGTTAPVGYTTAVTETSASLIKDTDGAIAVQLSINRATNLTDGTTQAVPGGIVSYDALLSYDPAGIQVMGVRGGTSPFADTPVFDPATGILSGTATTPLDPGNSPVAKILIRLIGNATTPYTLTITFQHIMSAGAPGMDMPPATQQTFTFLRGDANGNGVVNIADAMFIAQYLVGIRPLSDINMINAASVKQDGSIGDIINIADAMFIAQYLVGLRDVNYNLK